MKWQKEKPQVRKNSVCPFVVAMAMQLSNACLFSALRQTREGERAHRIRGVASQDLASLSTHVEEEKVSLGASDLKVTRLGIGAWSWGDTSYWNNFQWDGN